MKIESINPLLRKAIFSIVAQQRSKGTHSCVGVVIASDPKYTLGVTVYHGVKTRQKYQAIFNDKKTDLHFVAGNTYSDFALVAIPTSQLGEIRPALPLTARDPGMNIPITCLGFPETKMDDRFGGHLTRSTLPNSGISSLPGTLLRYQPDHDIYVQPALPGGFSGGPVIHKGKLIGIISATEAFDRSIYTESYSHGPSAAQLICELHRWGSGSTGYFDVSRKTIDRSIREILLKITS